MPISNFEFLEIASVLFDDCRTQMRPEGGPRWGRVPMGDLARTVFRLSCRSAQPAGKPVAFDILKGLEPLDPPSTPKRAEEFAIFGDQPSRRLRAQRGSGRAPWATRRIAIFA